MTNSITPAKLSLKRIHPGSYQTRDGQWEVIGTVYPADDYRSSPQMMWYFRSTIPGHPFEHAHDLFDTKRDAVKNLAYAIAEVA